MYQQPMPGSPAGAAEARGGVSARPRTSSNAASAIGNLPKSRAGRYEPSARGDVLQ